jgi:hypothetical protein
LALPAKAGCVIVADYREIGWVTCSTVGRDPRTHPGRHVALTCFAAKYVSVARGARLSEFHWSAELGAHVAAGIRRAIALSSARLPVRGYRVTFTAAFADPCRESTVVPDVARRPLNPLLAAHAVEARESDPPCEGHNLAPSPDGNDHHTSGRLESNQLHSGPNGAGSLYPTPWCTDVESNDVLAGFNRALSPD